LERDLGFKVNELAGFDEEKLVFTLLVMPQERLYCLFQRRRKRQSARSFMVSDGTTAGPGRSRRESFRGVYHPRSIADKINTEPFDRDDLLLAEELAIRLSLDDRDPTTLVEACDLSPALYKQGRQVVERLDLSSAALDAFDGVVGPLSDYWRHFSQRGPPLPRWKPMAGARFSFCTLRARLERLKGRKIC
jgi:hypothetical protein